MADWREALAASKPGDYGIIGDPIGHSLSLRLQQPAFDGWWQEKGGDPEKTPRYILFHVHSADLGAFMRDAKARKLAGFNVTVPHKAAVMPLLDRLDSFARVAGAVNTVKLEYGGLAGYNTDGPGFARTLADDLKVSPETALVLGAGGTGQVIVQRLLALDVGRIYWWNRTLERLRPLVDRLSDSTRVKMAGDSKGLSESCAEASLVVNATSVGLNAGDGLPAPGLKFRPGQAVFDVVYHRETSFLIEARKAGARVCGGLPMLLYQGAAAFEIWTGKTAPIDLMKASLLKAVKEKGMTPVWPSDT